MAYSEGVLQRARLRLAQEKAQYDSEAEARRAQIYSAYPRLREIDQALRKSMAAAVATAFRQGDDVPQAMEAIKKENLALQREREWLLEAADLDEAVRKLSGILPDMLKLAETEKACQRLAAEIERTRRRVNALEHVVIPETREGIRYITMKLDENERSAQVRLLKVKDKMLKEILETS